LGFALDFKVTLNAETHNRTYTLNAETHNRTYTLNAETHNRTYTLNFNVVGAEDLASPRR